jgi:hypothetical protein
MTPRPPSLRSPNFREVRALRTGKLTRERACTRKHAFTQDRAVRLANKRRQETGEGIWAYPCLFCGLWHLGHPSRRMTK